MPGNASIGERLYLAAVRVCRGSTRRTSRLFVPFATDDIRLCDQTTPHVATIAVVIGRRLASFGFIPSMTALRFRSNFSTQSRTGAWDPHIGLLLLPSQFWPIPSMSRRVINCTKLCLSHPFGRIKWIRQWAVDRDPVLTSTTSAKIGKTAICMWRSSRHSRTLPNPPPVIRLNLSQSSESFPVPLWTDPSRWRRR